MMSNNEIISIIKDRHSDLDKLQLALFVVRSRIEHCLKYNLDMQKDPLLSKVLLFK